MLKKIIFISGSLVLSALSLQAQVSRADNASRTSATLGQVQAATATNHSANASTDATQEESDLGAQQPVSAASGGIGAYAIGQTSLFYTSNALLTNGGHSGDMYFVGSGGGGIHPNLFGDLYLDGHISEEVYNYASNTSLDFNHMNAGGGLDYVFQNLGQLTASVRYEYDRYLDNKSFNEFYVNNALTFGLSKQFTLNNSQSFQLGTQGSWSLTAEPEVARRDSYDFWAGWTWQIAEPLQLQTYYVISLYYYPNDGSRVDCTQNVGTTLSYSFTSWAKISASASFGGNSSTESTFNYTVVNLGGTLGVDFRF